MIVFTRHSPMVAATRIVGKLAFRRASPLEECSVIHDAAAV
jgi:hypothetical protein